MKFRTRLLILLLAITLVPLSLSFIFQRAAMIHFGNKLANDTRSLLNNGATSLLHALVDDYSRILKRDKAMALMTLQSQAQAIETRLSSPPPEHPDPIFFSADYTSPQRQPKDLMTTDKYQRRNNQNGELLPIPISYSQQTIFLVEEEKTQEMTNELRQLSTMPEVYKTLHDIQPDLFLWQYTTLRSGIHSSYPGKGGYPDSYDPRQRQWYKDAVFMGEPTQHTLTDVTTGALILTFSRPIYAGDGRLAGVTALDIDYRQFFADWKIPPEWADAERMILVYHEDAPDPMQQLEILLSNQSENRSADWRKPIKHEYLDITAPQLKEFQQDLITGNSAVRKIRYRGQEALWAYGSRNYDEPFPLVIIPYQQILAQAVNAEKYVNQRVSLSQAISATLTIIVVAAAILLAIVRSRKVTQPIMQLAAAANQLSDGNFDARVKINTGDELENLGIIFNGMGDRLKERDQMQQSLALAKEIQQQLLPESAPDCPSFDLAGKSLYCDETGGDYFDFIQLKNSSPQHLGLAVGDVSGHGIGSALVMATARGALHSSVDRYGSQLEILASELNNHLFRGTSDSYFMTLFYGVLDPDEKTLMWASAGHAPTFLYRADSSLEELGSSGLPLGIIENTPYEAAETIKFKSGDILLIGTDGIWETRNEREEMFGTKRVCELLIQHAKASAEDIANHLTGELESFRGKHSQDDDITLMVVKAH